MERARELLGELGSFVGPEPMLDGERPFAVAHGLPVRRPLDGQPARLRGRPGQRLRRHPPRPAWWATRAGSTPGRPARTATARSWSPRRALVGQLELDGEPGELMAEGVSAVGGDEHAGGDTSLDVDWRGLAQSRRGATTP